MSDEMKLTSEDAKITAGNAPRRDSAEAAALTVGSPSSSSSSQTARSGSASKRISLSLATRVGIAALAVVSVLFIGASAFALTNGFGLPADSPVVKAAESVGIVRSADVEAASADGADEAKAGKGEDSNEADAANKESEDKKDASSDASGSDESKSKGDGSSSDNVQTTVDLPIRAPLHPRAAARLRTLVQARALLPRAPLRARRALQARVLRRVALRNRALPHLPAR